MMINNSPKKEVKTKKDKICSEGIVSISTVINFISPAPITLKRNRRKPIESEISAGVIYNSPFNK